MTRVEHALALHAAGSSCSQAVLTAFAQDFGLPDETAHRIATGLGAGLGRQQLVCGAVSGAALVLGLALGARKSEEQEAKEATYAAVCSFVEAIRSEFGAVDCRALLEDLDLRDPAGKAAVKERGLPDRVCNPIIRRSVRLLEERLGLDERR